MSILLKFETIDSLRFVDVRGDAANEKFQLNL